MQNVTLMVFVSYRVWCKSTGKVSQSLYTHSAIVRVYISTIYGYYSHMYHNVMHKIHTGTCR